jgi:hypothetical protein
MLQFTMDEQTESEISCRAEQIFDSSLLSVYALNGVKSLFLSLQVKRMTRYAPDAEIHTGYGDTPDTFTPDRQGIPDTFTPDTPIRCCTSVSVRDAALTLTNRFYEPTARNRRKISVPPTFHSKRADGPLGVRQSSASDAHGNVAPDRRIRCVPHRCAPHQYIRRIWYTDLMRYFHHIWCEHPANPFPEKGVASSEGNLFSTYLACFFQAPPGTLRVPRRIHYLEHMRI